MLVRPSPMCPRPKILGCCIPWTKCPLAILPPDQAIPSLSRALVLRSGGVLCVGRACIRRRGANSINLVRGVGEAGGQTPHWSIRCRRPTEAAIAADGASSMLDVFQGRDTLVRDTISKRRFVQGAQHPRVFGRDTSVGDTSTLHQFFQIFLKISLTWCLPSAHCTSRKIIVTPSPLPFLSSRTPSYEIVQNISS